MGGSGQQRGRQYERDRGHVDALLQHRAHASYDEAGTRIKVITPRGVNTASVADDFTRTTVYDELSRIKEEWSAYDPGDARYNKPDKTIYTYDAVGRLDTVSAPPSSGESVRNDTAREMMRGHLIQTEDDTDHFLGQQQIAHAALG